MRFLTALALAAAAAPLFAATVPPAPPFPAGPTTDTFFGTTVADPYRGLENGDDPAVAAWSDAENARTRAYLDGVPDRAAIAAKHARLIKQASPTFSTFKRGGDALLALYRDPAVQQPVLVRLDAAANPATRRTVLDPNALASGGQVAIDWFEPSPDGSKVAVSLSRGGSEDGTLHLYDVATGREIEPPIERVQYPTGGGSLAWTADGRGFFYTRYPGSELVEGERHFNMAAFYHRLGTSAAADPRLLGAAEGVPRTGEIFLHASESLAALASVQLGDGGEWQHFVLRPGRPALRVAAYADRIVDAAMAPDGTLFGLSRKGAPRGKVVKLSAPYAGGFAAARTIIAEDRTDAIIDGASFGTPLVIAGNRLIVSRIAGGPNVVTAYDFAGGQATRLPLPRISAVYELAPMANGDLLYSVSTYLEPTFYSRWSSRTGRATPTAIRDVSPTNYADATVTRLFATSKDGTRVPVNVIARKGVRLDGHNPTLLYGYGGYGSNQQPSFSAAFRRLWLDAGGVYAVANIRGGGEYGNAWHTQGMLTKKQNVFDDFVAAGEALIARGYTSHDKLALQGGSNGGLLMGAVLTQHPGLARAVSSSVGIYDSLRFELDPNGAFNVTELSSVRDPAQFAALYAYSPLHHVRPGTRYPAVLLLTGANDGRVNPLNSRKFAAALQAAQANPDHPILLRTSKTAGHGHGSSLDEMIFTQVDQLMFLIDQLGMDSAAAAR